MSCNVEKKDPSQTNDNSLFPSLPVSIIEKHSIAQGMNLSLSSNKSSGIGEIIPVSPYIEFMYMACNPWKFANITAQGRAESLMRLKQIYKEYATYFTKENILIDALVYLLQKTLDTFTRRERIHIIDRLISTGLLTQCFGDHSFTVVQTEKLSFHIYYMGKETYVLTMQEQKDSLNTMFVALANNSVSDITKAVITLGKQEYIKHDVFIKLIEEEYLHLPNEIKESLQFGAISKDIALFSTSLLSLIDLLDDSDSILVDRMYYVLSSVRRLVIEKLHLTEEIVEPMTSILDVPWNIIIALGESGILITQYVLGTTVIRIISIIAELQKSIVEEKSILWILNSVELFIDAGNIEYESGIENFLYGILKTIPFSTIEMAWKRLEQKDCREFVASFAFAYHHTNNEVCHRIYFFLSYLLHALSHIMSEEYSDVITYNALWDINEDCLCILSQYGVHVEEVYLLHRLREVTQMLASNKNFDTILDRFFDAITAFGEQYYKAVKEVGIDIHDARQQANWCRSLLHRVLHIYGDLSRSNIIVKLTSSSFLEFKHKHTFMSSHREGSSWYGSWLLMEILEEYVTGITSAEMDKQEEFLIRSPQNSSIFSRRIRKPAQSDYIELPNIKEESFLQLAEKCTQSPEGIHVVRKSLTEMNVSQDILVATYLRIAVQNKLISLEESIEIYNNLHATEGVDVPLFKVNLSNALQLKGHLHEIRMASTASMFGFDVYAMNKVYRADAQKMQYEVDILMKKYGKTIGVEVKDLSDTKGTNFKDVIDAVEKMGAFKKYQGDANTLAILTQTGRPPSPDKLVYLNDTAQSVGVQVLYGGIREQLLQIDKIAKGLLV